MTAWVAIPLLSPEEAPEGLWEALAASCRLLKSAGQPVTFTGPLWRCGKRYLAQVSGPAGDELLWWEPGEALFVPEGGS